MKREQIIKALECCIVNDWNSTKCNECPIYNGGGGCIDELKEATLTLINSQEQRIGELTEENERLKNSITFQVVMPDDKMEEIKAECLERVELDVKKCRADTVRKMQERLEAETITIQDHTGKLGSVVLVSTIDQIAKEILENGKARLSW